MSHRDVLDSVMSFVLACASGWYSGFPLLSRLQTEERQ